MTNVEHASVPAEAIASAPICAGLSAEDIATLARHLVATDHRQGEQLYVEGSEATDDLLIILAGDVEISTREYLGGETLVLRLDPGDVAGILGFVGGRPHVGTAHAVSDCRVGRLSRAEFAHLCESHGGIAIRILSFLVLALDRFSSNLIERYKESLSFMYGSMHAVK